MFEWKQLFHIEFLQCAPATVCMKIAVDHKPLAGSSLSHCEINMLIIGFPCMHLLSEHLHYSWGTQ